MVIISGKITKKNIRVSSLVAILPSLVVVVVVGCYGDGTGCSLFFFFFGVLFGYINPGNLRDHRI
jgi:hypothetical protein